VSTIDDRIAELQAVIASAQKELDVLSAQSGQVQQFIKQAESDGTIPSSFPASDVATIIDLWEKFQIK
jgi:cell division protein FtsB